MTASALAVGLGALLTGTALVESAASAELQATTEATERDRSRRVCRNVMPSGSRLSQRVCRTQADWNQSRDKTQQGVLEHQTQQSTGLTPDPTLSPMSNPNIQGPNRP